MPEHQTPTQIVAQVPPHGTPGTTEHQTMQAPPSTRPRYPGAAHSTASAAIATIVTRTDFLLGSSSRRRSRGTTGTSLYSTRYFPATRRGATI